MVEAIVDETAAQVREELQATNPTPPATTETNEGPTETACMTSNGIELNTLIQT